MLILRFNTLFARLRMGTAVLALLVAGSICAGQRPNIVFILVDDLGLDELGCYGARTGFQTPNIDRLSKEGTRFSHAMAYPMCSPTRAAIMSGRHGIRTGIVSNVADPGGVGRAFSDSEYTIGQSLRDAGYDTGIFGKLHLHWDSVHLPDLPKRMGFDESFTYDGVTLDSAPKHGPTIGWPAGGMVSDHFHIPWTHNGEALGVIEGYSVDLVTDEAIKFIEKDRTAPFLAWLPYIAIHEPFQAPERWIKRFPIDDAMRHRFEMSLLRTHHAGQMRGNQGLATYRPPIEQFRNRIAMAAALDESVGQLMDTLDRKGLAENTLVIFLGDNGPHPIAGGGKAHPIDAAVRVPLIMRWPGVIPAGEISDALIEATDFHTTLTDLAEGTIPDGLKMDGMNILRALDGNLSGWRDMTFSSLKGTLMLADHDWFYNQHADNPNQENFYRRMTPPNQIQEPTPVDRVPEAIKERFRGRMAGMMELRKEELGTIQEAIRQLRREHKDPYLDRLQKIEKDEKER